MPAMQRNPFQYLLPVAPSAFVGRWPLVKQIALDLTLDSGDSHALIAGRRCGKSSLLNALAHRLRQPSAPTDAGDWLALPLAFDFKAAAFVSVGGFFAHILAEARRRVDANTRRRPVDAWSTAVTLPADWFQLLAAQPALTLRDFEDAIGYLLDQLDTAQAPVRLILLLDEVDEVLDEPWLGDLFNQLRALIYSGDLKSRVRIVLVGSRRFLDQVSDRGSPLWNVLKLHYLEVFSQTGFAELTVRAPSLSPHVADAVWQQSGGHPFLTQYLLYHLWDQHGQLDSVDVAAPPTEEQVQHLALRFQSEQITDLQGWNNGVEAVGLRAYQALAQSTGWLSEEQIIATVAAPALAVKRGLTALCYHGVARHANWSHYQCAGELFRSWVTRYATPTTAHPTPPASIDSAPAQPPVVVHVNVATNTGSGAIAQGGGAVAAGERAAALQGDVQDSSIVTGDHNRIDPSAIN